MKKKIIIIGATSGIGKAVCKLFIKAGWQVGIAGRRTDKLQEIAKSAPQQVVYETIDICKAAAETQLLQLINKLGGMDYFFHVAGVGKQNKDLDLSIELKTAETNVTGFIRMVDTAFNYFKQNGGGHIAIVSSVAGTKGLGTAPAYSATKTFNYNYIQALSQLAKMKKHPITFTDIRPGFIRTELLNPEKKYPMMMEVTYAAKLIYKAVIKKKRIQTIDWRYALLVKLWQLIPNKLWERLSISN